MNVQDAPNLVILIEGEEVSHPLSGRTAWTVGRSSQAEITLADDRISRRHAMIQKNDSGGYTVLDLGSRNGSFVNGRRITFPCPLTHGDRIALGSLEITFHHPAALNASTTDSGSEAPTDADEMTLMSTKRTLISTLVVDVRDFTGMTHRLGDETLSKLMTEFFNQAGHILEAHGSYADKYIGDSVMAIWFHDNEANIIADSRKLFMTLCDLIQQVDRLTQQYALDPPFKIGAGINTGYAIVGNTGTANRPDYTALGDSVTKTFRLESACKPLGVDLVMGEESHRRLTNAGIDNLPFQLSRVELKGYPEPSPVFTACFDALPTIMSALGDSPTA